MDWKHFFAMGGYAFYVWTSYGLVFLVLILNIVVPLLRKARLHRALTRAYRRRR